MTKFFKTAITVIILLLVSCTWAKARSREKDTLEVTYPDEYLDTVKMNGRLLLNDYSLIGIQYGATSNRMLFNPSYPQEHFINPGYMGISFIHYCKMFGYMPYFGFRVGLYYGKEGYQMKMDKETGRIYFIDGASKTVYDIIEMPISSHFHYDLDRFKITADLGFYGGYRLGIARTGIFVEEDIRYEFTDHDKRLDYGLMGGVGVGFAFDHIEFHINFDLRYSWGTIWEPDYASKYYYRFGYPFDFILKAGVFLPLSKRTGKTSAMLRREAKELVYGRKK